MSDIPGAPPPAPKTNKMLIGCAAAALVCGCGGLGLAGVGFFIAKPAFEQFQCKALQSEAKAELRGLYTAERSFFAEYGFYTSDLVSLGWTPSTSKPRYVYGFYYAGPDETPGAGSDHDVDRASTEDEDVMAKGSYSADLMVTTGGDELGYDYLPEESFVEKDKFVAAAVADLKADDFDGLDIHLIDQDGKMDVLEDDCDSN